MRALVQRVTRAAVRVDGEVVGRIDRPGLLVLVGVTHGDGADQVQRTGRKLAGLRLLRPADGSPLSAAVSAGEAGAPLLVVSQFTLYADTSKGRRPSWSAAAPAAIAEPLVQALVEDLRGRGLSVATGVFGADMAVELVNDGPVTVLVET